MLFGLFLVIPVVEIAIFIVVGNQIGLWPTVALVLASAAVGSTLVAQQGRTTWLRLRAELVGGSFPGKTLAHAAMILVAGAFLLTPGFLTDALGIALLFPPVREWIRKTILRRYRDRWIVIP